MTDRQSNKQNMATATQGVLTTNLTLFETIVAFFTQYGLLGNSLTTINSLSILQGTDITGYAVAKENQKNDMADLTMVVAGPLTAFARINDNQPLLNKVDIARTDIVQAKDEDAPDIANLILSEANKLDPVEIVEIGLLPANLTDLNTSIVAFEAAIPEPREAISIKEATTEALDVAFETMEEQLETLDELIEPFKATEIDFYNTYKNARKIVDMGSRHISLIIKCTDSVSDAVVVGAEVNIVELPEELTTSRTGNARFFSLPPGSITVNITADFYEPVTLNDVGIFDGETTRFDLAMVKT